MHLSEILTHLGEDRKNYFNAVAPPIIQSSNFVFDNVMQLREAMTDEMSHHLYTRGNNPTVEILRKKIAALENADDCLITSSGAAAIATAIITQVSAGDHIICIQKPYSWTFKLISQLLAKFNVSHDFVDGRDINNIQAAIRPNTRLLVLESPCSVTFEIQDLKACADLAKSHNITTIIDNSHCSPIFQRPIDFGIDLVVHSGTKYFNGHSDIVMGVICGSKEKIHEIFNTSFLTLGTNISPHDAAMAIRGLRTLEMRVKRSDETAHKVLQFLKSHPKIEKVIFPFDSDFPQYALAKKQMSGCGGLLTLVLKSDSKEGVFRFCNAIEKFLIAVSWGGYESLMIPSITFHDMKDREDSPIPWTYVRLYIGLESADYLIADLEQALQKM